MNNFIWRPINQNDLSALTVLDTACLLADGPASVPIPYYRDLLASPDVAILCAASSSADAVAAVAWVRINGKQALVYGKVHPAHRHQRLGTYLLRWAEAQANALGNPAKLIIRNETFNAGSAALYAQEGYTVEFVENWMQRDLRDPLPLYQPAINTLPWTPANAPQFFDVYVDAFKERPGFPGDSADQWISDYTSDSEFRPDLSLLAVADNFPIGFVTVGIAHLEHIGEPLGWISQIGVRPTWRGRGIASGLITSVMVALKHEGLTSLGLHVNTNNPGAMRLYQQLGFQPRGQRAKYAKVSLIARLPTE